MTRLAGFDVSVYQAVDDYPPEAKFGIIRAAYGSDHDPRYSAHYTAMRRRGLTIGAYCFGVGGAQDPVEEQARRFLAFAANADLLFLDQETNWLKRPDGTRYIGPTMTNAEADLACRTIQTGGRRIDLYHSRSGFPSNKAVHYNGRWVADYSLAARLARRPLILQHWDFWQWTSTGGPGGTPLDRDWFNGDAAALAALVKASHV